MPCRKGVTAPISPDSRTTGTIGVPRRKRAGSHSMPRSIATCHPPRSLIFSVIPLPRFNHFLSRHCQCSVGTPFAYPLLQGRDDAPGKDMKIYLLMILIGAILTAVQFTSAPEKQSEPLQR
jgi:hypothetical protein